MGKQKTMLMDLQSKEYLEKVKIMTDLIKSINLLPEEDITKIINYVAKLQVKEKN